MDMNLMGPQGSERAGATWTITSKDDHPGLSLMNTPRKVPIGTLASIGLQKTVV